VKIVKYFFIASTLLLVAATCKTSEQLKPEEDNSIPQTSVIYTSELTQDMRSAGQSEPLGIESVEITGNQMSVGVKYSGGCKVHDFKLIGHKMLSKSLPPIRSVKIIHNSNEDDCREIIEEVLIFDISNLAFDKEEIIFMLDGYSDRISYTPVP
jgi:hypothetical protein